MKYVFYEYPPCSTCRKARNYLKQSGIEFTSKNIKETPPTKEELKTWIEKFHLERKVLLNTSGLVYKENNLKEKFPQMTEDEQLHLLETTGMLIKRPILVSEQSILIGFKETVWEEKLREEG